MQSNGWARSTASGSILSQSSTVCTRPPTMVRRPCCSIRWATRTLSDAIRAWCIASATNRCCSYHRLARRCKVATASLGMPVVSRCRSTSAKRWWYRYHWRSSSSGTTNKFARSNSSSRSWLEAATPVPRLSAMTSKSRVSCRNTASHRGPHMRSRMAVWSKKC